MASQHHLGMTSNRIQEQDSTVLRATHEPLAIRRQANAKYEILGQDEKSEMTLGGLHMTKGLVERGN